MKQIEVWKTENSAKRDQIYSEILTDPDTALAIAPTLLRSSDRKDQILALNLLRDIGSTAGASTLATTAQAANSLVLRAEAIFLINHLRAESASETLRSILNQEEEPLLMAASLYALGTIGTNQDTALFKKYLHKQGPSMEGVRIMSAVALARRGSAEGLEVLLTGSFSQRPRYQRWSIEGLGLLQNREANQRLLGILNEPDSLATGPAAAALAQHELLRHSERDQATKLATYTESQDEYLSAWAFNELIRLPLSISESGLEEIVLKRGLFALRANNVLQARRRNP